ncbi:hypothetical protein Smp_144530 [Schistosoma mansoni]|uniref:hypothetical protein n=1 Tax=Schistosoma mansoni TaxID=6183 RepID=UPI0001A6362D|nr:hypothetical protein Smp_144530 [Schistosoma mansoni]|eukprot:XP_018648874.1 hypothetical protein Smp_144530 [Schistosoma mansoni]
MFCKELTNEINHLGGGPYKGNSLINIATKKKKFVDYIALATLATAISIIFS